jgi:hypothetical protein
MPDSLQLEKQITRHNGSANDSSLSKDPYTLTWGPFFIPDIPTLFFPSIKNN